uniref:Uncharacterized protein n=1 Tax=Cacopsylla melanoneura TaxID=428564 RepID=A0A8D8WEK5_9HEMI
MVLSEWRLTIFTLVGGKYRLTVKFEYTGGARIVFEAEQVTLECKLPLLSLSIRSTPSDDWALILSIYHWVDGLGRPPMATHDSTTSAPSGTGGNCPGTRDCPRALYTITLSGGTITVSIHVL